MKHKGKTWVCPLCLEGVQPYGKNDCDGVVVCGNTPNANASKYLGEQGYKTSIDINKPIGIGLSEISNE